VRVPELRAAPQTKGSNNAPDPCSPLAHGVHPCGSQVAPQVVEQLQQAGLIVDRRGSSAAEAALAGPAGDAEENAPVESGGPVADAETPSTGLQQAAERSREQDSAAADARPEIGLVAAPAVAQPTPVEAAPALGGSAGAEPEAEPSADTAPAAESAGQAGEVADPVLGEAPGTQQTDAAHATAALALRESELAQRSEAEDAPASDDR
jgi:hypothetical protein